MTDPDLRAEVVALRTRLDALETAARRRNRVLVGLTLSAALLGTVASAANGNCPNGMPFCFAPDTPALASQVNMNFAQLKEWLEQKVGTAGTAAVTVTGGAVVSNGLAAYSGAPVAAPASTGRAAIFTGNTGAPTAPILEVRHDNLTQGIGIGWNTVTAVGSLPDIGINVQAKGNAVIGMNSHVSFNAGVCRPVSTPCDAQGTGSVIFLDRHNVACNGGEYLQQFRVQVCAGTANFRYDYTCCSF